MPRGVIARDVLAGWGVARRSNVVSSFIPEYHELDLDLL